MIESGLENLNSVNVQPGGLYNGTRIDHNKIKSENKVSFSEVLRDKVEKEDGVKFSNHAIERLKLRSINLTDNDISRINEAVSRADSKGSKDSLVLIDNLAFVVSIRNKTVITAMSGELMKENVITDIDSTVFA